MDEPTNINTPIIVYISSFFIPPLYQFISDIYQQSSRKEFALELNYHIELSFSISNLGSVFNRRAVKRTNSLKGERLIFLVHMVQETYLLKHSYVRNHINCCEYSYGIIWNWIQIACLCHSENILKNIIIANILVHRCIRRYPPSKIFA